ncbi:hypothetical protein PRZ48_007859 [Zasmidium cellare]|uniref:Uncharacterized protein n=1 Tax=Zasmidium cellare TaxID=395010 RepID=A0ABR0ELP0_ZASCE|nr:hypothetical protein PRZ48_007859 [Zasmidium cellare]
MGSGQQCVYGSQPVRWVGGSSLRGRRAATATYGHQHSPELPLAGNANADPVPVIVVERHSTQSLIRTPKREPTLSPTPSTPALDDASLAGYFQNAVLPRFQLSNDQLSADLAKLLSNPTFQRAISAVSRAHYSLLSKEDPQSTALVRSRTRHAAIASFRQSLQEGACSRKTVQELFSINVLLGILDGMIEPTNDPDAARFHLNGGFAMLKRWTKTTANMLTEGGLNGHLISVFATMDLVHALLSGDKPFFESNIWSMFAGVTAWFGRLNHDDRFLILLKAHAEMAALGNIIKTHLPDEDGVILVQRCLSPIESMLQPPACSPPPSIDVKLTEWSHFCSLYEIAGVIYYHRALRMRPVDDEDVQISVRAGVAKVVSGVLPGMLAHCTILPMLVIGAHCLYPQDRSAIATSLDPTVSYLSFGNLPVMLDFLKVTWARGLMDVTWWDMFKDVAERIFLF